MSFGEILRNLMEERDLTQKQLAMELNIAQSTLGGYVQNVREPDFETLKMFARYFHVSTDYLLNFDSEHRHTQGENEILRIFRSLSREQQEIYIDQGKSFIRLNRK
jgi:transcriptional regulator with XRE-family HTH domain